MLARLGHLIARRPVVTIVTWAVVSVLSLAATAGVIGDPLFDRLAVGAPEAPNSPSSQADKILQADTAVNRSLTLVISNVELTDPALADALVQPRERVGAIPGVEAVVDPLALPDGAGNPAAAPLVAKDGRGMLVVVELDATLTDEEADPILQRVENDLRAAGAAVTDAVPGATTSVGGTSTIVDAISSQVEKDLATGELIAFPIALVVMVVVFGGLIAAAVPLAGALASIASGLLTLLVASYLTDLDSSVINVVSLLGLGLSIDYGLLMVSRFREELGGAVSSTPEQAVVATMRTAGRTISFSALTVAVSIAGLMAFEPRILRAFGMAGVAIVLIAVLTSLTLTPALLTLLGHRLVDDGIVRRIPGASWLLDRTADVHSDEGAFRTVAARVQRQPWWVIAGVVVLLTLVASPALGLTMRNSGTEMLPAGHPERTYSEALASGYPAAVEPPIVVLAFTSIGTAQSWASTLADIDGVASVDPPTDGGSAVVIGVHPLATDASGEQARAVVERIRALAPGFDVLVTGVSARQLDFADAVADRAPLAATIVVVATFVLLFAMTGSLVIPLKALVTNLISIGSALGIVVWIFQEGHLEGLLGFTSTGGIETYVVVLVIAFAFGLAMDYEVFLLARIKELVDSGVETDEAVRAGLQRSGRIITSAAAVIVVVFAGFVAGDLLVIKEVGVALSVAVIIDATLVRLLLVPATMTVLGRHNWWAPAPLARLQRRWGVSE